MIRPHGPRVFLHVKLRCRSVVRKFDFHVRGGGVIEIVGPAGGRWGFVMSNVLIGIVGVILFIGLAVIGASFFGPVVSDSIMESRANGVIQKLATVANAVTLRNREGETRTQASPDASTLVPDYLDEVPTNPVSGAPVSLVSQQAFTGGGDATYVASRISTSEMCDYLNRNGGGASPAPTVTAMPNQPTGCVRAGVTYGSYTTGDYVAYVRIR